MIGLLAASPMLRSDVLIAMSSLVAVLLAGAVAVFFLERWRKKNQRDERLAAEDLAHFRTMFDRGELTEEEYDKVRHKTAERLKQQLGLAPPPSPRQSDANASPNGPAPSPPAE